MEFSLSQLFSIGFSYLLGLFVVAYATDKGWIPSRWVRHPLVYVLSLGVYAGGLAVYGVVGLAYQYGTAYISYFLGISGAFFLSAVFLLPLYRITRTYQLRSLADLFAFRYIRPWVGPLVTIGMLLSIIPLLVLQIQAVSDAVHILTQEASQESLALAFCFTMALFAILFGARHVSAHEQHTGLVVAMAVESLTKLVVLMGIAGFAVWHVFGGIDNLLSWLDTNRENLASIYIPLNEGPWRSLLLVFFAAAVVMPHLFHMGFTENQEDRYIAKIASWGFPVFLFLLGLTVPIILWAGIALNFPTIPEYFTLGVGLASESVGLTLVAYIGGLSAASGVIIVVTLAMAAMCLNYLLLPVYQPKASENIYAWLLNMRRILVVIIIALGYGVYRYLGAEQDLTNLGLIAFVATLQFLPGLVGILFWPRATSIGFGLGLIAGFTAWFFILVLPQFIDSSKLADMPGVFTGNISDITVDSAEALVWHDAVVISQIANAIFFILGSLLIKQPFREKQAANACMIDSLSLGAGQSPLASSPDEFKGRLATALGKSVSSHEVELALSELHLPKDEHRPFALKKLRDQIQANLSGLMGPTVAQEIVNHWLPEQARYQAASLPYKETELETYQLELSGLALELDQLRRYHRQTLHQLPIGVCILSNNKEITLWNKALERITHIDSDNIMGALLVDVAQPWRQLITEFAESEEVFYHKKSVTYQGSDCWFTLHKARIAIPTDPDTYNLVIIIEEITDMKQLEDQLLHNERLASIGRFASGVAHEIGNPVTAIACLAQDINFEQELPEIRELSEQIIAQTKRITRIVQSLISFAHKGRSQAEHRFMPVELNHCVKQAIELISFGQKSVVKIDTDLNQSLMVMGDEQQLVQIFVNLLGNAIDASLDNTEIVVTSQRMGDNQISIIIRDNGKGITKEDLSRIFEPFYTTKEPGQGTGLGLALVYSIMEAHNGEIDISSQTEGNSHGTSVKLIFPIHN